MNRALLVVALFVAPLHVLLTVSADARMECGLVYVDEQGMSIPHCQRFVQYNLDGSYTTWVEIGLFVPWEALR